MVGTTDGIEIIGTAGALIDGITAGVEIIGILIAGITAGVETVGILIGITAGVLVGIIGTTGVLIIGTTDGVEIIGATGVLITGITDGVLVGIIGIADGVAITGIFVVLDWMMGFLGVIGAGGNLGMVDCTEITGLEYIVLSPLVGLSKDG